MSSKRFLIQTRSLTNVSDESCRHYVSLNLVGMQDGHVLVVLANKAVQ